MCTIKVLDGKIGKIIDHSFLNFYRAQMKIDEFLKILIYKCINQCWEFGVGLTRNSCLPITIQIRIYGTGTSDIFSLKKEIYDYTVNPF